MMPSSFFRRFAVCLLGAAALVTTSHPAKALVYLADDGTSENDIGLTGGGTVIALQEFSVLSGNSTILSISMAFGTPSDPNNAGLIGLPFTVLLYSDPSGVGDPSSLTLLTSATGTVTSAGSDKFITVAITPTTVTTSNFFIGYSIFGGAGLFPAALDQTTDLGRSFVAGDGGTDPVDLANLNNNDIPPTALDDVGLGGNWLLRANAVPEPSTWAMLGLGVAGLVVWRRRKVSAYA